MSNQALAWAWRQSFGGKDMSAKFVLIALADQAGLDEHDPAYLHSCHPGQRLLAEMAECSMKTVERAMHRLEQMGLVVRERRVTDNGFRTSDRYVLDLRVDVDLPLAGDTVSPVEDTESYPTNSLQTLRPSNRASESEQIELRSIDPKGPVRILSFADFWQVYPRREDKKAAALAFARAARHTPVEVLIAGAERYRDDPGRDPAFTKLPATWLNKGSWENAPLPVPAPAQSPPRYDTLVALPRFN